jgi:uncharacterized membrane protein YhhN
VISLIYLLLLLIGQENISWFLKPMLVLALLFSVHNSTDFKTKNWLIWALFCSWIGDIVLLFADQNELYFIVGLFFFLVAHLLLIVLFIKQKSVAQNKIYLGLGIFLVMLYLVSFLYVLTPKLGSLKLPVTIYAVTIGLMLIQAIKGFVTWQNKNKKLVLFGATFFVLSDSILALNKFYSPLPHAAFFTMLTYILAQYLITLGIIKLNQTN